MLRLAGVLNVTPDSFYAGSRQAQAADAVARGRALWAEGAWWVDVGGESTRPGADEVPLDEELRRVLPVIEALAAEGVRLSVDTRKPELARRALAAGAEVVNDVGGLRDPRMVEVVAAAGAGVVILHMRGEPRTMQLDTGYTDLMGALRATLTERLDLARRAGVQQVWLDPGLGFGKSAEQNLQILQRLPELADLGAPLYVGASRKTFIGRVLGEPDPAGRLYGSIGVALAAAAAGAQVLRVHDVAATWQALALFNAATGRPPPARPGPAPGGAPWA